MEDLSTSAERGRDEHGARERRPVLSLTRHAVARTARRNVAPDAVAYVLAHGRIVQRTGVTFYFLGDRDIPVPDRRTSWAPRLVGTVAMIGGDGKVITLYRNRRAWRAIQRKLKYRLFPEPRRADLGAETTALVDDDPSAEYERRSA